jgi:hypothetical protein
LLVDCGPLQPPEAVHVVAPVLLQVSVDAPPLTTLAGVALRLTVGIVGDPSVFSPEPLQAPKRSIKPTNRPVRRFLTVTYAIDIIDRRGNLHARRVPDRYANIFSCASRRREDARVESIISTCIIRIAGPDLARVCPLCGVNPGEASPARTRFKLRAHFSKIALTFSANRCKTAKISPINFALRTLR